jgi:hypothetical protein
VGNADLQAIDLVRPLRPQTVTGAEAALALQPTTTSHIDLSLYEQRLDDAITFTPAGTDFVAQNETGRRSVYLRLNAHLRWVGERGASQSNMLRNNLVSYSLPGYTLLDLTVRSTDLHWPTTSSSSQLRLLFSVRNALDTRYSEPGFAGLDIPSLGRSYS